MSSSETSVQESRVVKPDAPKRDSAKSKSFDTSKFAESGKNWNSAPNEILRKHWSLPVALWSKMDRRRMW